MLSSFLVFFIVLSLLVLVHELGHFLVAKKVGIKVEEFGFGYPPRIFGKKIGETIYSLNWIPFGGFVRLLGQDSRDKKKYSSKELKRTFFSQTKLKRALVLLAGVTGNFLLAIICFTLIYSKTGIPRKMGVVEIVKVMPNSPAAKAGLKKGDRINFSANKKITSVGDFVKVIEENKDKKITLQTVQGKKFFLKPRENPPEGEGRIGVVINDLKMVFYPWWQMPFFGAWEGLKEALAWSSMIIGGLVMTIKQLFQGISPQMAGPVGIFQMTSQAAKQGLLTLVQFTGVLSVNLAILNLLPIPALDGCHLIFVFVGDWLSEKKKEKVESILNIAGMIFLISLMVLVTISDVMRIWKKN